MCFENRVRCSRSSGVVSVGDEPFDFDEQLAFGEEWERRVSERLNSLLKSISVENISFDENPELQLSGVDAVLKRENPQFDVKTQSHKHIATGNLPIETWSKFEQSTPGWFYTSESDIVVWVYPNKAHTNLYRKGYFMMLGEGIRGWFNDRHDRYRSIEVQNTGWMTKCRLVPIEDFPDEYLVEFDPRIPTDRDTPQSDLSKWSESGSA